MLESKDVHSIWNNIYQMHWNDLTFRLLNDMKKLAEEKIDNEVGLNSTLTVLSNSGFTITQTMAIRRLTDKSFLVGKKLFRLVAF